MNKDFRLAFDVLDRVFREGAYSNILLTEVLDKSDNRALVTKLVYGTLEKNITLEYYIAELCTSNPKNKIKTILKLGIYMQKFMDSIPDYVIVNEMVSLTQYINKSQLSGFVNATLKAAATKQFDMPKDYVNAISIQYSLPTWYVKCLIKQYDKQQVIDIVSVPSFDLEHIRANNRKISDIQLETMLKSENIAFEKSGYGGYFVQNCKYIRTLFDEGIITYQSPSSMLVCKACDVKSGNKVLDMCASPGGKSVYLSELADNVDITSCDLYPNRVEKIKEYCSRMSANNVEALTMDGSVLNKEFEGAFDLVLCDAPCSGFGVARKKPDIFLNKSYEDIMALHAIQYKLLNNAIDQTKKGGYIVYSTCTILREENYNVVGRILKERKDVTLEKMDIPFENEGYIQLLPTEKGLDGFFIARLKKC